MSPDDRTALIEEAKGYPRREKRRLAWNAFIGVCVLFLALGGLWYVMTDSDDSNDQDTRLALLEDGYSRLYEQAEECKDKTVDDDPRCATPAAPPLKDLKPDTSTGLPTVVNRVETLSPAETRAAVRAFCTSTGACEGEDATPAQVLQAVVRACDTGRVQCQGVAGQDAPSPTAEQLLSAVAAYCEPRNDCTPPAPEDGAKGDRGESGRGVLAIQNCQGGLTEMFSFDVVYTDGTTDTVSCGMLTPVEPEPEPDPEPEPEPAPTE